MEINLNTRISKNSSVDVFIQKKLKELGLQSTGSQEADLKAIQNALVQKSDENTVSSQGEAQSSPRTPEAIANFMEKLGLQPTNTKEGDNALITAKLSELESNAKTDTEKQNTQGLKAEFEAIIAQSGTIGQEHKSVMNQSFFNLKS